MNRLAARRLAYYVTAIGFGLLVHQGFVASFFGASMTDFFRRNSEAYALAVLIPAYWDVFAWRGAPKGAFPGAIRQTFGQLTWVAVLAGVAVSMQNSALSDPLGLPQSVITLGEAFVAAVVIAVYQGWSRGFLPGARAPHSGRPVVSRSSRAWYYLGVALATILIHQSFAVTLLGANAVQWLEINEEAYAAMLLLPAFFDFVSPSQRHSTRWIWFGLLVSVPVFVASGWLDSTAVGSISIWLSRTTEAFLAAIAVSIYFLWWRGGDGHRSTSEMADRFAQ